MKNKEKYWMQGSLALLFFVMMGYVVIFYSEQLAFLDGDFQSWLRGSLPEKVTHFYRAVTLLGNTPIIIVFVSVIGAYFYYVRHWRWETFWLFGNLLIMGAASTLLKIAYNRPRPYLTYLIDKPSGASFPSWHAASTMLLALSFVVLLNQRLNGSTTLKRILQALLIIVAVTVGLSRIYLGVHYPSDVIAGWLLALAIVLLFYPLYSLKRFEWRFKGKQK